MGKNGNDKKENDVQRQVFDLVKSLASKDRILTIPQLFIECFGSLEAGLFMSQCLHWCDKGGRTDGFFFKSDKEWMEEIHISRNAIRSARSMLEKLGILETMVHRANGFPTVHYRVNQQVLTNCLIAKVAANASSGTNDCPPQDERLSPTEQTLTEMTTEMTTKNKTLCPEGHNVSASAEYGEVTPSIEEPCPDSGTSPSLGTDPATLNGAAPRRRIDAGNGELYPTSPGSRVLLDKFNAEQRAVGHRGTTKFQAVQDKLDFEWAESVLGDELEGAITAALRGRGATMKLANVVSYVVTVAKSKSAKSTLPPLLFQKVAEAIRYNPEAQEHIPRISRLTETCQQRGYTEEQVRKAGKLWWETWPGNTGKGPNDAEFLQKIEIVKKERV